MDVQDVKPVAAKAVPEKAASTESAPAQTAAKKEAKTNSQNVTVDVHARTNPSSEMVSGLNTLIGTTNVVTKASDQLQKYLKGIKGIVEQVENGLPNARVALLEREANQLVEAVKETVNVQGPGGTRPLSGDQIEIQLEQQLGKSLHIMLPDLSSDTMGLGQIKLSTSDFILNTRAMVRKSEERLEELGEAVKEINNKLKGFADEVDIAIQNTEASQSTFRDVEFALRFAGNTGVQIGENPSEALESVGRLSPDVVDLLNNE